MSTIQVNGFLKSYLATAAWTTIESGECDKFTRDARNKAKNDCEAFITKIVQEMGNDACDKILATNGSDLDYLAAHDFWLTRNGHGAGFWDKEEIYGEEYAAKLTEISKSFGMIDCYHVAGRKSKLTF